MVTVIAAALVLAPQANARPAPNVALTGPRLEVKLEGLGSVIIQTDQKGSPQTVKRVVELVRSKFYDGQRFHRVEDWVVQWGAPQSKQGVDAAGVGNGGSGKNMPFEPSRVDFTRGTVGIASTGARRGGDSQLFIVKRDSTFLNGDYAVLGRVVRGMEHVDKLRRGTRITSISVMTNRR